MKARIGIMALILLLAGCLGGGSGAGNSGGLTDTTAPATGIVLSAAQVLVPAAGSTAVTVRIYAADNPVPLAAQDFSAYVSGAAQLHGVPSRTDDKGAAVFQVSHPGTENVTLSVSSGELSSSLDLYFGASVQVSVSDNFQRADGYSDITVSVVARDALNVPLSDIPVSLRSSSANAFFSAYQGKTGSNGLFSATAHSSTAETFEITAEVGGMLSSTARVTFVTPAGTVDVSAAAPVLPVNGRTEITVRVHREPGTTTGWYDDILPDAPFSVAVSGAATLLDVPARTDAGGTARFQVSDTRAENISLTVTSGTATQSIPLYFGASLALLPATGNAVGSAPLTALLKDGLGTPLSGQSMSFGFIGANTKTLTPITGTTDEQGTLATTVTDLTNSGGQTVIEARSGLVSAQATVNFLATLGSGQTLAVQPALALSAINQGVTFTAAIADSNGAPVSAVPVHFSVSGNAYFAGAREFTGNTDSQGKVYATLYDSTAENVTVTIQAGTVTQTVPVYFGAYLKLLPAVTTGSIDAPVELSAGVSDARNVGIAGVPVYFRATGGSALLDTFQAVSDSAGLSTVKVSNSIAETTLIEASVSGLPPAGAQIDFLRGTAVPTHLNLSTVPVEALISINGQATILAQVTDADNRPVPDGTRLEFSANGVGSVDPVAFTRNGQASVTFRAGTQAGTATVTATVTGTPLSASVPITIQPGTDVGSIEVESITPDVIGISGSGTVQNALIRFILKDNLGNPVGQGIPVSFSLGQTTLGGGETIASSTSSGTTVTGQSGADGRVEVTLRSGSVAGTVDIVASVGSISTVARVAIVGGMPDYKHFSLARSERNLAGGILLGLQSTITAYVGDRYGNIVPDGSRVSFISEGGLIGTSQSAGAFTTTTTLGQASAILQTAAPNVPELGGVAPVGNPGYNTLVAYTTGSESFTDSNGNGVHDPGEAFDDLPEPYIDANDSGAFELGELYVDTNNDGNFNPANGAYDSNTTIWTDSVVLFSDRATPASLTFLPASFDTCASGVQSFSAIIQDQWGNGLAKNSSAAVTATAGTLKGNTSVSLSGNFAPDLLSFELVNAAIPNCGTDGVLTSTRENAVVKLTVTMMDNSQVSKTVSGSVCTYSCQ